MTEIMYHINLGTQQVEACNTPSSCRHGSRSEHWPSRQSAEQKLHMNRTLWELEGRKRSSGNSERRQGARHEIVLAFGASTSELICSPSAIDWSSVTSPQIRMLLVEALYSINQKNADRVISLWDSLADAGRQSEGIELLGILLAWATPGHFDPPVRKNNLELLRHLVVRYREARSQWLAS